MILQLDTVSTRSRSQSSFSTPAKLEHSGVKCGVWYSSFLYPIREDHCPAIERHKTVTSFVSVLLCSCAPLNIGRFVVATVVYSVDLMKFCRRLTNIIKETLKGMPPFWANADATTAPKVKVPVGWPVAPSDHVLPSNIDFRSFLASVPVFFSACFSGFAAKTTATFGIACSKAVRWYCCGVATFATAKPSKASAIFDRASIAVSNHCKSAKFLTEQVDMFHADEYITSNICCQ
jgi:hypothetical protein